MTCQLICKLASNCLFCFLKALCCTHTILWIKCTCSIICTFQGFACNFNNVVRLQIEFQELITDAFLRNKAKSQVSHFISVSCLDHLIVTKVPISLPISDAVLLCQNGKFSRASRKIQRGFLKIFESCSVTLKFFLERL